MNEHQRTLLLRDLPEELVGERIVLRPWRAGDGPTVWEMVHESREHLGRWMPFVQHNTEPAHSEEYVRGCHASWVLRERFSMGIWHRETGQLLGQCSLTRPDWAIPSFEIGYFLRESAEGHGYMTEAVRLITAFAFDILGVQRLFIRCDARNGRSAAVPTRCGYVHEGTLRNSAVDPGGGLGDFMIFGMIPTDYARLRNGEAPG